MGQRLVPRTTARDIARTSAGCQTRGSPPYEGRVRDGCPAAIASVPVSRGVGIGRDEGRAVPDFEIQVLATSWALDLELPINQSVDIALPDAEVFEHRNRLERLHEEPAIGQRRSERDAGRRQGGARRFRDAGQQVDRDDPAGQVA
jgi:hypothetical protein